MRLTKGDPQLNFQNFLFLIINNFDLFGSNLSTLTYCLVIAYTDKSNIFSKLSIILLSVLAQLNFNTLFMTKHSFSG